MEMTGTRRILAFAAVLLAEGLALPLAAQAATISVPVSADTEIMTSSSTPSNSNGYSNTNAGTEVDMYLGDGGFNLPFKILLRFDLSSIPANVTITSATLHLTPAGGNSINAELHRLLVPWIEGDGVYGGGSFGTKGPTWLHRDKDPGNLVAWSTPGAGGNGTDRDASAISFVATTSDPAVNVLSDVALWYATPASNFGWVLDTPAFENDGDVVIYHTKENALPARDPYLEVTYLVPEPASAALMLLASAALLRRGRQPA